MSVNAASVSARIASRDDHQHVLAHDLFDSHAIADELAVGGGVLAEREQRRVL